MSFSDSESSLQKPKMYRPLLRVWEGDFGVPSIHPESLQIWTYIKINKMEIDVEESTFPCVKPIPSLIHNNKIYSNTKAIWEELQKLKPNNTDTVYSMMEQSRIKAYISYVLEYLETAIVINLWINERNYINFTRTWYRNSIYFPFNRMYIKKVKDGMDKHIRFLARDLSLEDYANFEYRKAQKCMADLAKLLDNKPYFLGNTPTTLDAYVFGYLSLLLHAPFQDNTLQNMLKGFPNLIQFVRHMTKSYFPETKEGSKYIVTAAPQETEDEAPAKLIVAAGIFAFTAMIVYATMIGQFRFEK